MTSRPILIDRCLTARRLFAIASWAMLGWLVVAFVSEVPSIEAQLGVADQTPMGHAAIAAGLIAVGLTMVAEWLTAVWYAIAEARAQRTTRPFLVAFLVWANFPGAFFYYFLYVLWQRPLRRPERDAQVVP